MFRLQPPAPRQFENVDESGGIFMIKLSRVDIDVFRPQGAGGTFDRATEGLAFSMVEMRPGC